MNKNIPEARRLLHHGTSGVKQIKSKNPASSCSCLEGLTEHIEQREVFETFTIMIAQISEPQDSKKVQHALVLEGPKDTISRVLCSPSLRVN